MTAATTASLDRAEQAIGQIAVELPGATAVFRRLKLDFCCGGQAPLAEACAAKGLDPAAVLAELATLDRRDAAPAATDPAALVEHILSRFHEVHRAQLPELITMARRVEAVHRDHPQVPAGLAAFLQDMHEALLDHMAKEEQVLFPMLQSGGHPMVVHPIAAMRHEHTEHGLRLDELSALTHDHTPPPEGCNTWQALYAGTRQLQEDLIQHIHLENNLLFPQFEPQAQPAAACC